MSFDRRVALLALPSLLFLQCGAPQGRSGDATTREGHEPPSAEAAPRASESSAGNGSPGLTNKAPAGSSFDVNGAGFLSKIPIRVSKRAIARIAESTGDEDFARSLRVRLDVMRGYKNAGELTRRSRLPLVNGMFQISDLSRLGSRDAPTKANLASSFVIDYEEKSLSEPVGELEKSGNAGTPSKIVDFVGHYISEKSYARSFDVASRVAATRSGDCTEHAVLTTALLRRFGFKARVILGIVLLGVDTGDGKATLSAFGHAWVEHYDHGRWWIADAALGGPDCATPSRNPTTCGVPPGATRRLAYLPVSAMKDESVSFNRALMDQPGVESIVSVDVDAT